MKNYNENFDEKDVIKKREMLINHLLTLYPEHQDEIKGIRTSVGPMGRALIKMEFVSKELAEKFRRDNIQ